MLRVVDDALKSAAEAEKKTSEKVNWAFRKAIQELERFEMKYHPQCMVNERMAAAKAKDNVFSTIFKETFSPKVGLGRIHLLHLI